MSGEWTLIETTDGQRAMEGEEAITDICLLTKKEKVPAGFTVLEVTLDGKKADFAEGMFSSTRRYLAYTKKVPSSVRGRIMLIDLKVVPASDRAPLGYLPLAHTYDDNTKAFSSKVLVIKVGPHELTTQAVTEIQILSASRKEDVPTGLTRLPDINGFSICYKVGEVSKRRSSKPNPSEQPKESPIVRQPSLAKNIRSATDGVQFKLSDMMDKKQYLVEHSLGNLTFLSLDDIENKFSMEFSEYHRLANPT